MGAERAVRERYRQWPQTDGHSSQSLGHPTYCQTRKPSLEYCGCLATATERIHCLML